VKLFDWEQIMAQAKPGDLVVFNMDPVFLAIMTGGKQDGCKPMAAICRGRAVDDLLSARRRTGECWPGIDDLRGRQFRTRSFFRAGQDHGT
jgi:hypothetical protein